MNRYLSGAGSSVARERLAELVRKAATRVSRSNDISDILGSLQGAVADFAESLHSPTTSSPILSPSSPRSSVQLFDFFNSVEVDLSALLTSAKSVAASIVTSFNAVQVLADSTASWLTRLSSTAEDLAIISGQPASNVFVAGDRFADSSKIDPSYSSGSQAEIVGGGGAITLRRVASVNVGLDATSVDVRVGSGFNYDLTGVANSTKTDDPYSPYRVYEGRYFALAGQMVPSGGRLTFESRPVSQTSGTSPGQYSSLSPGAGFSNASAAGGASKPVPIISSIEAVRSSRLAMLDGRPDTVWQIESTFEPFSVAGGDSVAFHRVFSSLTHSEKRTQFQQVLSHADKKDFEITLTVDLGKEKSINWINLLPENFGEDAWLEITDLSTALSVDGPWELVDGFLEHVHENVLTPDANAELTLNEFQATLAPSRYGYSGQGIWHFRPRAARYVRMVIRQLIPIPAPYEVIRYKLGRTVTTTLNMQRSRGLFS